MKRIFIIIFTFLIIILSGVALIKMGDKKVVKKDKKIIIKKTTSNIESPTNSEINIDYNYNTIASFKEENFERYKYYNDSHPSLNKEEIVKRVNVNLDYDFYEKKIEALNPNDKLILVNKYYYIGEDYIPNNLKEVNISYASSYKIYAVLEAVNKFEEMCQDAKNLNLTIKTISAYRSYDYQKKLYDGYLNNDPQSIVDTYSARPGHSEHQTGYAFDVYNENTSYTNFGSTKEFTWIKDNAHRYGFILRYTKDYEYITGYKNEPWHLRYVGIEHATSIYNKNITLEEYLLN